MKVNQDGNYRCRNKYIQNIDKIIHKYSSELQAKGIKKLTYERSRYYDQ